MKMIYLVIVLLISSLFIVACAEEELQKTIEDVEQATAELEKATETEEPITSQQTTTQEETKPSTTQTTEEKGTLEEIKEGLEKTKSALEDYKEKTDKLDECTRLCAGEDYDVPYIKDTWWTTCYELYYYGGEEVLDEQIAECQ